MPAFMLPRFVDVVAELPRTEATLRVRKAELRARGRSASAWDAEAS
jgi:crotonobetaine/carnitine-CoA ligase